MKKLFIYTLIVAGLFSCAEKDKAQKERAETENGFTYIPSSRSGVKFQNILSSSEFFNIVAFPQFYDGGGVAIGDINHDKLPDLYFVSNQWDNKLYLNKGDFEFEDITQSAGVAGSKDWERNAVMVDWNKDGWLDLFVQPKVYLNKGDLTFELLDSINVNPNGGDNVIADFNNDGLTDGFVPGRFPFDDKIIKTTTIQPSNKLYINAGGAHFSDIAWYAGVAATDWSSRPAIADFDGDGLKDIFIPGGVVGRMNDLDYLKSVDSTLATEVRASKMPNGESPNFFFRQTADLKFEDVTEQWIGRHPAVSGVADLGDLDNDGDIDIVVNNTNSEAYVLRNDIPQASTKVPPPTVAYIDHLASSTNIIPFKHNENAFNTFDRQPMIPFTNATRGPKMAVADINGDKLDDVFIGGGQKQPGAIFIQTKAGKFVQLPQPAFKADEHCEETCAAFFDADGDRDMDLIVGSGGEEFLDKRISLRLYLNNGRGTFSKAEGLKRADLVSSLQKIYVNASCIIPVDIDNDKDIDVFVGGGTVTGRYGVDSDSFILLNDGKGMLVEGPLTFENRQRPGGMVQAAAWVNLDGDEYPELIAAGDWMTVGIWKNDNGVMKRQTGNGLDSAFGFWNSLVAEDMDGDNDIDIVAGNFGLNGRLKPTDNEPLELEVRDIDKDGRLDPVTSYYSRGQRRPIAGRDDLLKQVPSLERTFPKYSDYANARMDQLLNSKVAISRKVNTVTSTYFENQGNGKFIAKPLPGAAQYFPVLGMDADDVDGDGDQDLILVGNLKATQPGLGSYSEGYGLILINKGNGNFEPAMPAQSGFMVIGEGRDIKTLTNFKKEKLYLVTRNNDSLVVFKKEIK